MKALAGQAQSPARTASQALAPGLTGGDAAQRLVARTDGTELPTVRTVVGHTREAPDRSAAEAQGANSGTEQVERSDIAD
jgi:hypothetical protein